MEKQQMNQEELLKLLNQCLYAYSYAENKAVEKLQIKNIKKLKSVLKRGFGKRVIFDKEKLEYVFKD